MCFVIDPSKSAPRRKYAYKVFHVDDAGVLQSPYPRRRAFPWTLGVASFLLREGACTNSPDGYSVEGYYVFDDLKDAEFYARRNREYCDDVVAIVRVEALPADFLHSSFKGWEGLRSRASTYRRIVPKKVLKVIGINSLPKEVAKKYRALVREGK